MGRYTRYVALGDSSTEGLDDPDGMGGYRGWANRLAERIAGTQDTLLYANLGVRGLRTRQILERQLEPALAMRPDLVSLFSGTNDVVARRFDADRVRRDLETMQSALIDAGATVIGFTLPDLSGVLPLGRWLAPRVGALNEAVRDAAASSGALLVDFAQHPVASDRRLWSEDRFHANARGHALIATALAEALGLEGADSGWRRPFSEEPSPAARAGPAADLRWAARHLVPWVWRHARGRSSGDGRAPKRPDLIAVA